MASLPPFTHLEDRPLTDDLTVRLARCGCERCERADAPHYVVAATETEEPSWVILTVTDRPEATLDTHMHDEQGMRNLRCLSILYGCGWKAIEADAERVYATQLNCSQRTPLRVFEDEPAQLKCFRSAVLSPNPADICELVRVTEAFSRDPGGTAQRGLP